MNRSFSLRGRDAFRRLAMQGKTWSHGRVRIRYTLDPDSPARFAVSASRALGNAVRRNRVRRIWKEALRLEEIDWPGGSYRLSPRRGDPEISLEDAREVLRAFRSHLAS